MSELRTIDELLSSDEDALPLVRRWASEGGQSEIYPTSQELGEETLLALQVTTRSPLGALACHTGGIEVGKGWLRVLGARSEPLGRGITDWNRLGAEGHRMPGALLVADDAIGGFFAINGGAMAGDVGNVFYLAPDTLEWENTERGHTDWLYWVLTGDLKDFYASLRWRGCDEEVASLPGDRCIQVYPFLWAAGPAIAERSRRDVPVGEAWSMIMDMRGQLPSERQ